MAIELYDVSVAGFLQTLGAVEKFLEKGRLWCVDNKVDLASVVERRLATDMFPFRFQVISSVHHSLGAIKGAKAGLFGPPAGYGEPDYAGLQKLVTEALAELAAMSRAEINALEGADMVFALGERKTPFLAQDFLMSFSLPNFHFHATTTYGHLRALGAPLGKRDYMGRMRAKA